MGGHGGLNILPQKKWNVYNYDNREKVRKDEEEAAREEQLKREQSHKRDFEFRLEQLRQARGLASSRRRSSSPTPSHPSDSHHINLFEGIHDFSCLAEGAAEAKEDEGKGKKEDKPIKRKREEKPVVVAPEDEKYRMGYGVAGKGVKEPWYLKKTSAVWENEAGSGAGTEANKNDTKQSSGKKTIEQLREERMKREKKEKERERRLLSSARKERDDGTSHDSYRTKRSRFSR